MLEYLYDRVMGVIKMQKSVVGKNLVGNETKSKSQQTQGKSANATGQPKRLEKKQAGKKQQKQP